MKCQLFSWMSRDENNSFVVYSTGRQKNTGKIIKLRIMDFQPFCYLCVRQPRFTMDHVRDLYTTLKNEYQIHHLLNMTIETRFPFSGYSTHSEKYVKCVFSTHREMQKMVNLFRKNANSRLFLFKHTTVHEHTLHPVLRLQHVLDLRPSGWVSVETNEQDDDEIITVSYRHISPDNDDHSYSSMIVASFDIEVLSYDSYVMKRAIFPDATNSKDTISQIGITSYSILNPQHIDEKIFVLIDSESTRRLFHETDPKWIVCRTERDLLLNFAQYVHDLDPDVLTGYNIFLFDYKYIIQRCEFLGITMEMYSLLSRFDDLPAYKQTSTLSSSAYGDNEFVYLTIPGRCNVDLYVIMKKEHRLDSYKLDDVSEYFMKERKHDLKPYDLFQKLKGSVSDIIEVGLYCIQDTKLVLQLIDRLNIMTNLIEMSKITQVPLDYLITRGQQIKCFSQIAYMTYRHGYILPTDIVITEDKNDDHDNDTNKYQGATVLEPKKGLYLREGIVVLDFASLYPSIIVAKNLCFSTHIRTSSTVIDHENVETIKISESSSHHFVKSHIRQGLLPQIVLKLWSQRKKIKKEMNDTTDPHMKSVLNGKQLAIKVSMNSLYGFCGAIKGFLPCKPIAESITAIGRELILFSKNKVEELYPESVVVYGDSDSIYVKFSNIESMTDTFRIAYECQDTLNTFYPKPIEIEMEKVYKPFMLFTKKRYCAVVWERPDRYDHTEYKGLSVVRRDFCKYTKETINTVLNTIMYEADIDKSRHYVSTRIEDLLRGYIPDTELILTKSIKSTESYKSENLPHIELVKRMKQRDPNNYPLPGERLPFVYIINGERLLCDRSEHIDYVREHQLQIDRLYYLENQLSRPILEIFNLIDKKENNISTFLTKTSQELMKTLSKYAEDLWHQKNNKKHNQSNIYDYFKKK